MNEDYYPLITLIFLFPLIFSPYSIEGLFAEDMENQAIIQFEYPRSLTDLKTDIQIQLQPELSQIYNDFDSTNSFLSLSMIEADDQIINFLKNQEGKQKYEINLQEDFALEDHIDIEYNGAGNIFEIQIKDRIKS